MSPAVQLVRGRRQRAIRIQQCVNHALWHGTGDGQMRANNAAQGFTRQLPQPRVKDVVSDVADSSRRALKRSQQLVLGIGKGEVAVQAMERVSPRVGSHWTHLCNAISAEWVGHAEGASDKVGDVQGQLGWQHCTTFGKQLPEER